MYLYIYMYIYIYLYGYIMIYISIYGIFIGLDPSPDAVARFKSVRCHMHFNRVDLWRLTNGDEDVNFSWRHIYGKTMSYITGFGNG